MNVRYFKKQIQQSDAILICTPEYAHGVPGILKNAIDWTVATCDFNDKYVALITASSDGRHVHASLQDILEVLMAKNIRKHQLLVPFIKTKLRDRQIIDEKTLDDVRKQIDDFILALN